MMRDVVKSESEANSYRFILSCGHTLPNPRGYHSLEDFKAKRWCDVCHVMELNKGLTNTSTLGGSIENGQYNPNYESVPVNSFTQLLHDMQVIHDKKRHDYSHPGDRFSNFTESGIIGSMFKNPTDTAFAVLIGVKLSRLSNLLGNKLVPNNESIDDTFLDLTTYCALWAAYHKDNK